MTGGGLSEAERSYGRVGSNIGDRGRWYSEASVERILAARADATQQAAPDYDEHSADWHSVALIKDVTGCEGAKASQAWHVLQPLIGHLQREAVAAALAAPAREADPEWPCDNYAEPHTCLSAGASESALCRVCKRVAADRLLRAIRAALPDASVRGRVLALADKFNREPFVSHQFYGFVVAHDLRAAVTPAAEYATGDPDVIAQVRETGEQP